MGFQETNIYRRALELVGLATTIARDLPRGHAYLADQLKRSTASIALNFAEGYGKATLPEQRRFFGIAMCSANEVAAILDVARCQDCISLAQHEHGRDLCDHLAKMLNKFRRT